MWAERPWTPTYSTTSMPFLARRSTISSGVKKKQSWSWVPPFARRASRKSGR